MTDTSMRTPTLTVTARCSSSTRRKTWQLQPCFYTAALMRPPPRRGGSDSNSKPSSRLAAAQQAESFCVAPAVGARCEGRHSPCTARTHLLHDTKVAVRRPVALWSSNVSGPTATPATLSRPTAELPMTTATTMAATTATSAARASETTEGAMGTMTVMMIGATTGCPTRGGHAPLGNGYTTCSSPHGSGLRQTSPDTTGRQTLACGWRITGSHAGGVTDEVTKICTTLIESKAPIRRVVISNSNYLCYSSSTSIQI